MTEQANEIRGEVEVTLDGQSFVLRPSWEAILAIEKQTGRSVAQLAFAAEAHELTIETLAIIVTECIRAWGKSIERISVQGVQPDRIGELIFSEGLLKVIPRVAIVLLRAVTGGVLPSGEPKATGTTTPATPVAE
ncbi:hypothetical protein GO308_12870 [Sphingomonas sp. SFZ2018-12]|uniref:GTA-gp10 family protein n=1 Tax=Sphingomonas sp. SFZ2018-12 TaxID=2683197 RepID=UPI001F1111A4|nr:hypothetical protein [Sphingomonas sp. SFZ2018-12]